MTTRIGVDVGGTFTDLIYYDQETGAVGVAKGSTTPHAPEEGVALVVAEGVPAEALRRGGLFLHGTTVGLNALLERRGALVGLVTTRGFRDVLELRRGDREEFYSIVWKPSTPLVPRRLRLEISERMLANGTVAIPLDDRGIDAAARTLIDEGVEAAAVVFLNAYANPEHEQRAERLLRDAGFTGEVSLSHRVSGEYREYERTSTAVIDAYVRPRIAGYLQQLAEALRKQGFEGDLLVTRSGGGALSFAEAEERPFETIMSGPVAGAVGAAELCHSHGIAAAITADVGGTSFDTCAIIDGRPRVKHQGEVIGMPLQTPWVDVRSIGAGGGSLAFVNDGLLQVGPQSAGAVPGPVAYRRGGTQPTVTDAAAVLGMLGFGELAGDLHLDVHAARACLQPLADQLRMSPEEVASGIVTIITAKMANAIRTVTIEEGQDPRTSTLIAFGGAGPVFATLLARELEIRRILIPRHAGNFSAWGLLTQDVVRSSARTMMNKLDETGLELAAEALQALFDDLEARASGRLSHGGMSQREAALDLRYVGQEYTRSVPIPLADGQIAIAADAIRPLFAQEYEQVFGHLLDAPIELVGVRATTRLPLTRPGVQAVNPDGCEPQRSIDAYSFTKRDWLPFSVLERSALGSGDGISGPAILLEPTATTYIDAGYDAEVDPTGALFLTDTKGT